MRSQKEQQEFYKRLDGLKIAFPALQSKEVRYIDDREELKNIKVFDYSKDKVLTLENYSEILQIGFIYYNVAATSVEACIGIVTQEAMDQKEYCGKIGSKW